MRYGGISLSLLVLLLVSLQRNTVNTQSDSQLSIASRRYAAILREDRDSQLTSSQPARYYPQVNQPTSVLRQIPQSPQLLNNNVGRVQFDQRISNWISKYVLKFAQNVGVHLADSLNSKSDVFSPVSLTSALALLMLGAKGRSYDELRRVFGLDLDQELIGNPGKFHTELGSMLEDLELNSSPLRSRPSSEWRSTAVNHNMRNTHNNNNDNVANGNSMDHLTKIANGIFTQTGYSLNPDYSTTLKSVYRSVIIPLDFARQQSEARDFINAWVAESTYGKIPNIIQGQIPSATNVILASALYFKGFWENEFFELATTVDNFYPDGKNAPPVKVQMMATGGAFPYYESVEHDCRIIGLPYKGNTTAMYIIQPNQSTRNRIRTFQRTLNAEKIEELISKMVKRTAIVAFPKFHLIRSTNMRSILHQMGINDIFASGVSDLSLISEVQNHTSISQLYSPVPTTILTSEKFVFSRNRSKRQVQDGRHLGQSPLDRLESQRLLATGLSKSDLFVEDIVHKVDFEVNEHGTEAAAASLTYLRRSGTDILFRTEEPFIFLVRDDPTKLTLFYGYYIEPEN